MFSGQSCRPKAVSQATSPHKGRKNKEGSESTNTDVSHEINVYADTHSRSCTKSASRRRHVQSSDPGSRRNLNACQTRRVVNVRDIARQNDICYPDCRYEFAHWFIISRKDTGDLEHSTKRKVYGPSRVTEQSPVDARKWILRSGLCTQCAISVLSRINFNLISSFLSFLLTISQTVLLVSEMGAEALARLSHSGY